MLSYIWIFLIGGFVCSIGQLLIIKTKMTSARILVTFVMVGVVLETFGIFDSIASFAKAGINVPIIGFGASMTKGAIAGAEARGIIGAFAGGLEAVAAGVASAVLFAFIFALIFKARTKKD
ncbi:MAG: SpoVA/SpoVAEb family sporulation membrane protein [Clostridia bacterium]|jgi:stage V sporulation protein AE|nr:SpoVA/SpoVAEb family sporulation membrane protein [Clostridia bacterium]MDD3231927.1 SpoVA/SpoVAEb family sporulation membrane protein [Clostridia bacterium]MDD3862778.1 SpoVA/SpoVAEb family sporulation membrane protein [Clostridia bacterium]MDD4408816.1 SpoVA/SpoVAEb family sporulation membrane protein [Clostridia bacterium]